MHEAAQGDLGRFVLSGGRASRSSAPIMPPGNASGEIGAPNGAKELRRDTGLVMPTSGVDYPRESEP